MAELHSTLPVRSSSAWNAEQVTAYLQAAPQHPLRLAIVAKETPLIVPLWYRFAEGSFWCASPSSAKVVQVLQDNPRCAFDVSVNDMPYRGVRGQGFAEVLHNEGETTLQVLIERYLGDTDSELARWLLSRADQEVAIAVRPTWISAWDYSARMAGASATV